MRLTVISPFAPCISSSNMLMSDFLAASYLKVCHWCDSKATQCRAVSVSLFPSVPHPIGVHHYHQNKLLLTARVIFLLSHPWALVTLISLQKASAGSRRPCFFFFFCFPKPLAVSLATAKCINICSHSALCYSALVNALLQHNRLCALPLNIHKH